MNITMSAKTDSGEKETTETNGFGTFNGFGEKKSSLVNGEPLDNFRNGYNPESWIKDLKKDGIKDIDLTEEEITQLSQVEGYGADEAIKAHLVFSVSDDLFSLSNILKIIEIFEAKIEHLETRKARKNHVFDILTQLVIKRKCLLDLIKSVRQSDNISVSVLAKEKKAIWFPKHISDLDRCTHILSKFEPDLDSSHPGFSDAAYRSRRMEIALIAFSYKQGQPIPPVQYSEEEIKTWNVVYRNMSSLHSKYACLAYKKMFSELEKECQYSPSSIPQLEDVSQFLKKRTGFTLRPAAGLVSARDFLGSLAFRVFQCTQYVRHSSSPHHSPEPDCIHELLGHIPMFADPEFAKFSQEIGFASLGASDEDIEKIAKIYWFTVEFGLCKENGKIKAYGAGLLSSYGELEHAVSGMPQLLPFEAEVTTVQQYQDFHYQDVYFVADGFIDAKDKMRNYVYSHFRREYEIFYDPYTERIQEIDSLQMLKQFAESTKSNLSTLVRAINHLNE